MCDSPKLQHSTWIYRNVIPLPSDHKHHPFSYYLPQLELTLDWFASNHLCSPSFQIIPTSMYLNVFRPPHCNDFYLSMPGALMYLGIIPSLEDNDTSGERVPLSSIRRSNSLVHSVSVETEEKQQALGYSGQQLCRRIWVQILPLSGK